MPLNEHEVRKELAAGQSAGTYAIHAHDHLQFPAVIVEAIQKKHKRSYFDARHLLVVVDGAYTQEDDQVIHDWIDHVRKSCSIGEFTRISLVERGRKLLFPILDSTKLD